MQTLLKKVRTERGSAIAGLALALPAFLALILGVLDLGRGYMTYVAMSNAAREGARWISTYPTDRDGGIERVEQEITARGINPNSYRVTVTPSKSKYQQDEMVEVKIEYDYDLMFGAVPGVKEVEFMVKANLRILYEPISKLL